MYYCFSESDCIGYLELPSFSCNLALIPCLSTSFTVKGGSIRNNVHTFPFLCFPKLIPFFYNCKDPGPGLSFFIPCKGCFPCLRQFFKRANKSACLPPARPLSFHCLVETIHINLHIHGLSHFSYGFHRNSIRIIISKTEFPWQLSLSCLHKFPYFILQFRKSLKYREESLFLRLHCQRNIAVSPAQFRIEIFHSTYDNWNQPMQKRLLFPEFHPSFNSSPYELSNNITSPFI